MVKKTDPKKQKKESEAMPDDQYQPVIDPSPKPLPGYLVMALLLSVVVVSFAAYVFNHDDTTPLAAPGPFKTLTAETEDSDLNDEAMVSHAIPLDPTSNASPTLVSDVERPVPVESETTNQRDDDVARQRTKVVDYDGRHVQTHDARHVQQAPSVMPTPQTRWQIEKRDQLKALMMEKLAVDTLFHNAEQGRPFKMDLEIVEQMLASTDMRALVQQLAPYAQEGMPNWTLIKRMATQALTHTQQVTPLSDDPVAAKVFKSILRISKKQPLVPKLKTALANKRVQRSLILAQQLMQEGYPLEETIEALQDYQKAHTLLQHVKVAYHAYFIDRFNHYNTEHP